MVTHTLKCKLSKNSSKEQEQLLPKTTIYSNRHLKKDCLITQIGCSAPSNILLFRSYQMVHKTHNGKGKANQALELQKP